MAPSQFVDETVASAPTPVAVHVRRNHRAAWPMFLHISDAAFPHRAWARIVAGVDVIRIIIGHYTKPGRWTPTRRLIVRRHGLRQLDFRSRRRLCLCSSGGQKNQPYASQHQCRHPCPHCPAHFNVPLSRFLTKTCDKTSSQATDAWAKPHTCLAARVRSRFWRRASTRRSNHKAGCIAMEPAPKSDPQKVGTGFAKRSRLNKGLRA